MRILILSINYWPEETGIGAFTTYRAEYLASAGHEVTVCTTFPYYPEWKVAAEYRGRLKQDEERNGVRILRSYAYVPGRVTSLKRVAHEASYIAGSFVRAAGAESPDVLLAVSPPLGLGLSAIALARKWGVPFVFDVEDLQPDAAADLGMLPGWAIRVMAGVEKAAYRHAALVSTLTRGMRERIVAKGVQAEKVVLFEPRADKTLLNMADDDGADFRKRFELGDRFVISHSGNMGVKQGLDVVLEAAHLCRADKSVVFLMVGDGAAKDGIMRRARELGLTNVVFLPLLNAGDFKGLLAASDLCLVTQRRSVSDIVFPSKVVSYLAAGCAVVASVNTGSEVARAIQESGAGVVVEAENAAALHEAICRLRTDHLPARRRAAREYARNRWAEDRVLGFFEQRMANLGAGL